MVIGLWTSRLLDIDPLVALLGAAPGGISGMSLVGADSEWVQPLRHCTPYD